MIKHWVHVVYSTQGERCSRSCEMIEKSDMHVYKPNLQQKATYNTCIHHYYNTCIQHSSPSSTMVSVNVKSKMLGRMPSAFRVS